MDLTLERIRYRLAMLFWSAVRTLAGRLREHHNIGDIPALALGSDTARLAEFPNA